MFYNIVVHADDLRQWYPIFSREFYVVDACVNIRANLKKYGVLRFGDFSFKFLDHEHGRLSESFDWVIGHFASLPTSSLKKVNLRATL